jgi:hypothetical protein
MGHDRPLHFLYNKFIEALCPIKSTFICLVNHVCNLMLVISSSEMSQEPHQTGLTITAEIKLK